MVNAFLSASCKEHLTDEKKKEKCGLKEKLALSLLKTFRDYLNSISLWLAHYGVDRIGFEDT